LKKIPPFLLQRLSLDQRHKLLARIERSERHNRRMLALLDLLILFFPEQPFRKKPLKLLYVHGLTTLAALALFPPAPEVPPIAIPIVFAASFCLAYSLTAVRVL
jgi:hypothetical protein